MSKKGENIHKRKDGRWEARYRKGNKENGDITYASVYAKTYREVKGKLHNAIAEGSVIKEPIQQYTILFSELLTRWQSANNIRLKGGTKARYDNLIQIHILPQLGNILVSELSASVINEFLNKKASHGEEMEKAVCHPAIYAVSHLLFHRPCLSVQMRTCVPLYEVKSANHHLTKMNW